MLVLCKCTLSLEKTHTLKWPYPKENFSDDLILWNTSDQGVAGID